MELTFEKWDDGRWFVVLPDYDGPQEDLEMVDGELGGTYEVMNHGRFLDKDIWLCNVVHDIIGEHPEDIWFKLL